MRFANIHSDELPGITDKVKECINFGQWLLFTAHNDDAKPCFYLKANDTIYMLNSTGKVLAATPVSDVEIDTIYYFSDLPYPDSLSNVCSVMC